MVAERPADVVRLQPGPASLAITVAGRAVAYEDEGQAFQAHRYHRHGQEHGHPGDTECRADTAVIARSSPIPTSGYLRRFFDAERGDTILQIAFDERSVKWDLFAEIKTPYDVEQLARCCIPDHEGSDRGWRGYARTFLSAVALAERMKPA